MLKYVFVRHFVFRILVGTEFYPKQNLESFAVLLDICLKKDIFHEMKDSLCLLCNTIYIRPSVFTVRGGRMGGFFIHCPYIHPLLLFAP